MESKEKKQKPNEAQKNAKKRGLLLHLAASTALEGLQATAEKDDVPTQLLSVARYADSLLLFTYAGEPIEGDDLRRFAMKDLLATVDALCESPVEVVTFSTLLLRRLAKRLDEETKDRYELRMTEMELDEAAKKFKSRLVWPNDG